VYINSVICVMVNKSEAIDQIFHLEKLEAKNRFDHLFTTATTTTITRRVQLEGNIR